MEDEARRLNKTKSNFRVIRSEKLFELISKTGLAQRMDRIEVEQAVQFLHECGILLHYDDIQSNLSDLYFLDPQWLCSMMAKVITVKQLTIVSKGVRNWLKDIAINNCFFLRYCMLKIFRCYLKDLSFHKNSYQNIYDYWNGIIHMK